MEKAADNADDTDIKPQMTQMDADGTDDKPPMMQLGR